MKPLADVCVLDFTRVLAGPYCTALLADLGAEIIKVEPPAGDDYRRIAPFHEDGSSALFEAVNRGKRGMVLDLASPDGLAAARALADRADVVVENFRPGVAAKLGIGYADLSARNPRLVYASISGFGQDGPNAERPAYDYILQALTGMMEITGDPAGPPMPVGESIADVSGGLFGAFGILAALHERDRTGRGRHVDIGMFDAMIALQPLMVARFSATGVAPRRVGSRHALSAPFGVFRAGGGDIVITVLNEKLFAALATVIGRPELAHEPRFRDDPQRLAHEAELRALIEEWTTARPAAEAVAALVEAGVPAAQVQNLAEALASDQVAARPVLQNVTHSALGQLAVPEQPARFLGTPRGGVRPAPRLGEHTAEILASLQDSTA